MSADGKEYRIAVARRFAQRLAQGDCVLLRGAADLGAVPCTVTDGAVRALSNVNALVLMQVMQDRGLSDPRFFTAAQIEEAGWSLREEAVGVGVQYLVPEAGPGAPVVKRFKVFAAGDVEGPAPWVAPELDVSRADVARIATDAVAGNPGTGEAAQLRRLVVATWLEAAAGVQGLHGPEVPAPDALAGWIERSPLEFYAVVSGAEREAAAVLRETRLVEFEREGTERAGHRKGNDMSTSKRLEEVARLFAERQAVLAVPFVEKDQVAARGAVWHPTEKVWFVPCGVDLDQFKQWNPSEHYLGPTATEAMVKSDFEDAMRALGLVIPGKGIIADGRWHNVKVDVKKSNNAGAYLLNIYGAADGMPWGNVSNKLSGERIEWRYDGALLTPEARTRLREEARMREAKAAREEKERRERAAVHAREILADAGPATSGGYARKKGHEPAGLVQVSGATLLRYDEFRGESGGTVIRSNIMYQVLPMMTESGEVRNLQVISPDGQVKTFMRGAQKSGLMYVLGAPTFDAAVRSGGGIVTYGEGWATAMSFRRGLEAVTVVCFDAGNMETVVKNTAKLLPPECIKILAVDNDQFHVERALRDVAEKAGVNPRAQGGQSVQVVSRSGYEALLNGATRSVSLGEVVMDGGWHDGPKGRYCATIERDADGVAVRSVKVEVVPPSGHKRTAVFNNRGAEVAKALVGVAPNCVALSPSFVSLDGRPTDWNDLEVACGVDAVRHQINDLLEREASLHWWSDMSRPAALNGVDQARCLADACRLLEGAATEGEVGQLVEAIDERFLKQQIAMSGQDWPEWNKAIQGRLAALARGQTAVGVER